MRKLLEAIKSPQTTKNSPGTVTGKNVLSDATPTSKNRAYLVQARGHLLHVGMENSKIASTLGIFDLPKAL
jgi:hypothetical protein